jgi:hypothetical protein
MLNQSRASNRGIAFCILIGCIVLPSATEAVPGDINLDGVVDFILDDQKRLSGRTITAAFSP